MLPGSTSTPGLAPSAVHGSSISSPSHAPKAPSEQNSVRRRLQVVRYLSQEPRSPEMPAADTKGKILFVGDLHGNTRALWAIDRLAQSEGVQAVVQTGDFGILWPGGNDGPQKFFHKRSVRGQDNGGCDIPWFFCDGN